jgi:hypothetical protein
VSFPPICFVGFLGYFVGLIVVYEFATSLVSRWWRDCVRWIKGVCCEWVSDSESMRRGLKVLVGWMHCARAESGWVRVSVAGFCAGLVLSLE